MLLLLLFSFPPPNIEAQYAMDWLYDELDLLWRRWLPDSTSPTVRRGAFYSVLASPGFRIISLNMNYCNNKNWYHSPSPQFRSNRSSVANFHN